jgi:hypothetical protein
VSEDSPTVAISQRQETSFRAEVLYIGDLDVFGSDWLHEIQIGMTYPERYTETGDQARLPAQVAGRWGIIK